MSELPVPAAPDAAYARQRFIQLRYIDWARECDHIMLEHGSVHGQDTYEQRHQARWRAQRLIRLMVELKMHARWELREHVERRGERWAWSVEYLGGER